MTAPSNIKTDINELLEAQPELGYQGWRLPHLTNDEFAESRQLLARAIEPLNLCTRVFNDPRFMDKFKGVRGGYYLKHIVEVWDFNPSYSKSYGRRRPKLIESREYNGLYVAEGVAVAAALIAGYVVERRASRGSGSLITVPRATKRSED